MPQSVNVERAASVVNLGDTSNSEVAIGGVFPIIGVMVVQFAA